MGISHMQVPVSGMQLPRLEMRDEIFNEIFYNTDKMSPNFRNFNGRVFENFHKQFFDVAFKYVA